MVINFHMLHTSMENGIGGEVRRTKDLEAWAKESQVHEAGLESK
jgi:hypothetical protein